MEKIFEIKLMSKKFCILVTIIVVFFLPIGDFIDLVTNTFNIFLFLDVIISSAISIIIWMLIFIYSPSKIVIKDNIFVAERFIVKPIVIPVSDISKIRPNGIGMKADGSKPYRKEIYVIDYSGKKLFLNPIVFRFSNIDFDKTITELQFIVDNTKN